MVCKRQEQCKFGKMCGWAKDEETLLTECVEFIERVPLTNEEWLKSLDTEGLVDYLFEVHKGGASVERQPWIEKHKERIKMQIRGWLKEKHDG